MNPYQKVQPGERLVIPASAWNKMLDAIATPVRTGGELGSLEPAPNTVWIRNQSGHDVPRFAVLGVQGVAVDPADGETQENEFARRPTLIGNTPSNGAHGERFVVCMEPIKNGAFGRAACGGVFACRVNVTNATHKFAKIKDGDRTQLASATCGPISLFWVQTSGPTGAGPTGPNKLAVGVM